MNRLPFNEEQEEEIQSQLDRIKPEKFDYVPDLTKLSEANAKIMADAKQEVSYRIAKRLFELEQELKEINGALGAETSHENGEVDFQYIAIMEHLAFLTVQAKRSYEEIEKLKKALKE
jgi:hypothetical protein